MSKNIKGRGRFPDCNSAPNREWIVAITATNHLLRPLALQHVADCQKESVRQPRQETFALDIPFIELLITPELLLLAPFLLNGECAVVYSVGLQFTCYCGLSVAKGESVYECRGCLCLNREPS